LLGNDSIDVMTSTSDGVVDDRQSLESAVPPVRRRFKELRCRGVQVRRDRQQYRCVLASTSNCAQFTEQAMRTLARRIRKRVGD
jgi:hypothetical protein